MARILIVDDDEAQRKVLRYRLKEHYEVIDTGSPEEALALALHHKVLPPTIKVRQPLETLSSGNSPFYVNTEKRPWLPCGDHPRRAAVSAFGFGGSNFHCVVEEAASEKTEIDWVGDVQILAFQDATPEGIADQLAKWPTDRSWEQLRVEAARTRSVLNSKGCRLLLVVATTCRCVQYPQGDSNPCLLAENQTS